MTHVGARDNRGPVYFYNDDQCSDNQFITVVNERTECALLTGLRRVEGVKISNHCYNIDDAEAPQACQTFKAGASRSGVLLFNDDHCSDNYLEAVVSSRSDCDALATTHRIEGLRIHGACVNIDDQDAPVACRLFQSAGSRQSLLFYNDDSCSDGYFLIAVTPRTDFKTLTGLRPVEGIKINGTCQNIDDTDAVNACQIYQ